MAQAPNRGEVYLDYQSAKPVDPRVVEVMTPYFHRAVRQPGVAARRRRRRHRDARGRPREGRRLHRGTARGDRLHVWCHRVEYLALLGYANRNRRAGDHVVISEVDHISIHNLGKALEKAGFRIEKGAARSVRTHRP